VLIHRTAQVMQCTSDPNEHLIEVPRISQAGSVAAQPFGKFGTEGKIPTLRAERQHNSNF
jgi:hypothetical protein